MDVLEIKYKFNYFVMSSVYWFPKIVHSLKFYQISLYLLSSKYLELILFDTVRSTNKYYWPLRERQSRSIGDNELE